MKHLDGDKHYKETIPVVIIYVFNEKGGILLFKREKPPFKDYWETCGGHIEFGERVKDAAARELEEETGLKIEPVFVNYWDHIESDVFHRVVLTFAVKINSSDKITLREHNQYKWFRMDELPEKIVPGPFFEAHKILFGE